MNINQKTYSVQYEHKSEDVFLGRDYTKSKNFSDQVAREIDTEVKKIIESCYDRSKEILKGNKKLVEKLADILYEKETLTKEEIEEIVADSKL